MERIELLRKQLERIEKRKEEAIAELAQLTNLTFREKMQLDTEIFSRFKAMQEEYFIKLCKKGYKIKGEEANTLFAEFFELLLDQKVKNMKEFLINKLGEGNGDDNKQPDTSSP